MYAIILLGIALCWSYYLYNTRPRKDKNDGKGITHFEWSMYFQMAYTFFRGTHPLYIVNMMYDRYKNIRPFARFHILFQPVVIAMSLESVKNVFTKDFQHFQDRDFYMNEEIDPLSANLFGLTGERWTHLRKKLTPMFTSSRNKKMLPVVKEVVGNLVDVIDELIQEQDVIEIKKLAAQLTTDVIGRCALGIECNSLGNADDKFRQVASNVFTDYFLSFKLFLLDRYLRLAHFLGIRVFTKEVYNFFFEVVKDIIENREKTGTERDDIVDVLRKMDQLASLRKNHLAENEKLTLPEITAQCFVYFLAGMETTSNAMSFTFHEFANNLEIQDRAREHVKEVLEKYDGEITYEALSEMTYLEQCINESLRKYPPVLATTRRSTSDYRIPGSNEIIVKGTSILLLIHAIHNDPDLFPNPDVYDPERFKPGEQEKRHPYSFLPFGTGPRFCIGLSFANMQMKATLATLLANYRFVATTTKPLEFSLKSFTLTSKKGIYLKIEKL